MELPPVVGGHGLRSLVQRGQVISKPISNPVSSTEAKAQGQGNGVSSITTQEAGPNGGRCVAAELQRQRVVVRFSLVYPAARPFAKAFGGV
jgi:hypothetical protein